MNSARILQRASRAHPLYTLLRQSARPDFPRHALTQKQFFGVCASRKIDTSKIQAMAKGSADALPTITHQPSSQPTPHSPHHPPQPPHSQSPNVTPIFASLRALQDSLNSTTQNFHNLEATPQALLQKIDNLETAHIHKLNALAITQNTLTQKMNGLDATHRSILEEVRELAQRSSQYHDTEKSGALQIDIDNLWGHVQYMRHTIAELKTWQEKGLKRGTLGSFDMRYLKGMSDIEDAIKALQNDDADMG